ncbi:hypothetical protein FWD07_03010 [Candidatus Saccharibacteria bacterium]|nr:hypothetical protein [Candidatus Saccharibacteria bacterium]
MKRADRGREGYGVSDTRDELNRRERGSGEEAFGRGGAENNSLDRVKQGEGDITSSVGTKPRKGRLGGRKKRGGLLLRKIGPTGGVLGIMTFIMVGMGGFVGQGIFMQHLTSLISSRYDMVGFTSTHRTARIMRQKLARPTSDLVTFTPTSHARFSRVNARTARRLSQNFDLIGADGRIIEPGGTLSRGEIVRIRDKGTTGPGIGPEEFTTRFNNDVEFRKRIDRVYRSRVANWFDSKIRSIRTRLGIRPQNLRGTTPGGPEVQDPNLTGQQRALQQMNQQNTVPGRGGGMSGAQDPFVIDIVDGVEQVLEVATDGSLVPAAGVSVADARAANAKAAQARQAIDAINSDFDAFVGEGGAGAARLARNIGRFLNVMDWAYKICLAANLVDSAHQLVRTLQRQDIMSAATQALANADSIRAGRADPDVIGAFGHAIFEPASYITIAEGSGDQNEEVDIEHLDRDWRDFVDNHAAPSDPMTGPESQSFQWLAHDQEIDDVGGSLVGFAPGATGGLAIAIGLFLTIANHAAMNPVCQIALNPALGVGIAVASFAVMLIPGIGKVAAGAKQAAAAGVKSALTVTIRAYISRTLKKLATKRGAFKFATGVLRIGARLAMPFLINLAIERIAQIAKGEVCAYLVGQTMMDCTIVGAGAKHAEVAAQNGNLALGVQRAAAVQAEFDAYIAMVAEDERARLSPFDISSPHTFMGNLASSIIPHAMGLSSVVGVFSTVSSLSRSAMVPLLPSASAFRVSDFNNSRDACEEAALEGIATDPFCNPIYAIPAGWLTAEHTSPDRVLDYFTDFQRNGFMPPVRVNIDENSADFGEITLLPHGYYDCGIGCVWQNPLLRFEEQCMTRGFDNPLNGRGTPEDRALDRDCIVFDDDSDAEVHRKTMMALFFIDKKVEDNMNGSGMNHISDLQMDFMFERNIAHFDITDMDDETILAIMNSTNVSDRRTLGSMLDSIFGARRGGSSIVAPTTPRRTWGF